MNNLNALILIGGKSTRMGTDKSKLIYHNQSQINHVFNLLKEVIVEENIFYSVRDNSQIDNSSTIVDLYPDLGPFSAIYSAFSFDNTKSWLVLAIDIPFVNIDVLNLLIKNRDESKIATTFQGKTKKYPEPLITIWENKSFPLLKVNLENKKYSLVNLLNKNEIKTIPIEDNLIENINTKEEYRKIKKALDN